MEKWGEWLRNVLAVAGVLALGMWLGSGRTVKASAEDFTFEMAPVGATSALLVYQASTRSIYVYQGATTGSSNLQCSYKYVLGSKAGDAIQRLSCPVPTMH